MFIENSDLKSFDLDIYVLYTYVYKLTSTCLYPSIKSVTEIAFLSLVSKKVHPLFGTSFLVFLPLRLNNALKTDIYNW